MVKSMYAAVAGLKTHQSKMDVIGNNIANVNTYGYKKERASFADTYYATSQAASEATATRGGANPSQVGYGVQMGGVTAIVTTGGAAITDNPTDVMITGNGYFMVGAYNAAGATTSSDASGVGDQKALTSLYLTRVGIFSFDGQGSLVDGNSQYVYGYTSARGNQNLYDGVYETGTGADRITMGWIYSSTTELEPLADGADPAAERTAQKYMVSPVRATDGTIIEYRVYRLHAETADGRTGITVDAANYYYSTTDDLVQTMDAGDYEQGAESLFTLDANSGYNSAKDYKVQQNTGYVASIATGVVVSSYDAMHAIQIPRTYTINGYVDENGDPLDVTLYSENDSIEVKLYRYGSDGKTVYPVYTREENGAIIEFTTEPDADGNVPDIAADGVAPKTMTLKGEEYWNISVACKLNSISVGADGTVSGVDENNRVLTLGKIAVANVPNPTALEAQGNNYYLAKANTGVIEAFNPGEGSTGALKSGTLEMSNVDLSTEFTDMITTQRGYQANSRIITVTDSMLEELVNLKRG
ncbi:MAG: flagellar hook-basal body complex protein [Anaerovoracaceae bacterium]